MKKKYRLSLYFLFLLPTIFAVRKAYHDEKGRFRLYKIQADLPYNPVWDIPVSQAEEEKTLSLLDQPFYFLSKGGQFYAFASADGTLVFKVFKHYRMRPESWLYHLPVPPPLQEVYRSWVKRKKWRLEQAFGSCAIAFQHLKEETGLVYLHLNKTTHLRKKIFIYDKEGLVHSLPLDTLTFVLQKKAVRTYDRLEELIANGETEKAKRALSSLVSIISSRKQKQIDDYDPVFKSNFGFVKEQAIEIDLGSFLPPIKPITEPKEASLQRQFERLEQWLEEKEPSLALFFREERRTIGQ